MILRVDSVVRGTKLNKEGMIVNLKKNSSVKGITRHRHDEWS